MGSKTLKLTVGHATDLENVRKIFNMKVYAAVSISGGSEIQLQNTSVDEIGGISPTWDCPMQFTINVSAPKQELVFQLKCKRTFNSHKDIGEVRVSIGDLLTTIGNDVSSVRELFRPITTPSGVARGELAFSYSFCEVSNNPGNPLPPPVRRPRPGILERVAVDTGVDVGTNVAASVALAPISAAVANHGAGALAPINAAVANHGAGALAPISAAVANHGAGPLAPSSAAVANHGAGALAPINATVANHGADDDGADDGGADDGADDDDADDGADDN